MPRKQNRRVPLGPSPTWWPLTVTDVETATQLLNTHAFGAVIRLTFVAWKRAETPGCLPNHDDTLREGARLDAATWKRERAMILPFVALRGGVGVMTTDIMCCGRCGNALKIVCPKHGDDYTPDRRMDSDSSKQNEHSPRREPVPRPTPDATTADAPPLPRRASSRPAPGNYVADRIFAAMATVPSRTWTAMDLQLLVGKDRKHVTVEFATLLARGRIVRVGVGKYRVVQP